MNQDLERYKKLLNEWKSSEMADSADEYRGTHAPENNMIAAQAPPPASSAGQKFLLGTLICLDGGELAVYQRACAQEGRDIVLLLMSDGSLKVDRIDLGGREVEEIGYLRPDQMREMKAAGRWSRALIAGACRDAGDADRIPSPEGEEQPEDPIPPVRGRSTSKPWAGAANNAPSPRAQTPPPADSAPKPEPRRGPIENRLDSRQAAGRPAADKADPDALRRGRRITLKMGARSWSAVYWGRDLRGHVLVHNTAGHWELTRLNLDAYKKTMILGDDIDAETMSEIMRTLDTIGQMTTERTR